MPAIRIDWQNIKNEVIGNGQSVDEPFLFVLPHGGRHLLMSIIDTLKYQATYRIEDYDYSDWDSLLAMVELTHLGLMEGEQVQSIAESITYLADTIADNFPSSAVSEEAEMINNQTVTINGCGCGGTTVTTSNTSGDDLPPDGYDIPPVVPDEPTVYVDNVAKCDRSGYLLVQYRNACLSAIEGLEGNYTAFQTWFDGLVGWLASPVPVAYDVYLALREWLSLGAFTNTDDFLAAFDPNFDSMLCQMYTATTATEAKTAVRETLESYVWSAVSPYARLAYKRIFELMPFDMVYDESVVADVPLGYRNRQCCGSVPVDNDLGLWVAESNSLEGGYCGPTTYQFGMNNTSNVDATVALSKSSQYDGYYFTLARDCSLSDATYFTLYIDQTGDTDDWTVELLSGTGAVVATQNLPNAASGSLTFDATTNFVDVERVRVARTELYNKACPRNFTVAIEINTDSVDWTVY